MAARALPGLAFSARFRLGRAGCREQARWMRAAGGVAGREWPIAAAVNLDTFPLHAPESAHAREVVDGCRQRLRADGYCILRRFLRPGAIAAAVEEVRAHESTCFVHSRRVNMWGENPQQHGDLPANALRRLSSVDSYGVVARDELGVHGALATLYTAPAFVAFAASIAGRDLHTLDDELAGCTGEILRDGQARAWRFAPSSVTAVALLQRPESGGLALGFRDAAGIKEGGGKAAAESDEAGDALSAGDDIAVEALRTILQAAEIEREASEMGFPMSWRQIMEDMDPEAGAVYHKTGPLSVESLNLEEGDVLLMEASRALVRFSQVQGERPLLTSTWCFEARPGERLSSNQRKRLFGRKKRGISPPLSSTFPHCYTPVLGKVVDGGVGEGDAAGRYVAVVSERNEGRVRHLVRPPRPLHAPSSWGASAPQHCRA